MAFTSKRENYQFFRALPPYLGGKRKLLKTIFKEIARHVDPQEWRRASFIDGFVGGGSVSIYAKAVFGEVLGNDYSDRSARIAHAVLCNNSMKILKVDCQLLLSGSDSETQFARGLVPDWFIPGTADVIDRGLAYADTVGHPTKAELLRFLVWYFVLHSRPSAGDFTSKNLVERAMSGELKPTGIGSATFAFRPPDIRDAIKYADNINAGVFGGNYSFTQRDALEASKEWGADVVYLDPPYAGDATYEKWYRMADSVMAQRQIEDNGVSPFSEPSKAEECIDIMAGNVHRAGAKLLVWSNSDEAIPRERQLALIGKYWDVYEVPVEHKHSIASSRGTGKAEESGASEVLIVGRR